MKTLFVFAMLFSINSFAKAAAIDGTDCPHCTPVLTGTPEKAMPASVTRAVATLMPSENITQLAHYICMQLAGDGNKVAENVKTLILKHLKEYENLDNPSKGQIIKFLNHNKNYMKCSSGKNYMKESFDHGRAYDQLFNVLFFDELLTDDESLFVDVNAISDGPDGNPETVLDYMYRQMADLTNTKQVRDEIESLIEFFELDLGAKRYSKLTSEEKGTLYAKR